MLKLAVQFWVNPRASMRGVLDRQPGESLLAALIFLAVMILLAGRFWIIALTPTVELGSIDDDARLQHMAANTTAAFLLVLVFYGFAAIGTLLCRLFRGTGGFWHGRVAFFWAALMSAPLLVASNVAPLLIQMSAPGAALAGQFGPVLFAWALSQSYAEAFGFPRAWRVFAGLAVLILLPVLIIWMLSG